MEDIWQRSYRIWSYGWEFEEASVENSFSRDEDAVDAEIGRGEKECEYGKAETKQRSL